MSKQIQEAYIVAATRLPVGKRNGMFRNARPDDMLAHAIRAVVAQAPGVDPTRIGDVIVGCAIPEAEQGMNVARIGALLAGLPNTVPGITINRFCSSGLQAVADAANQIRLGLADVMIAAGTESMTAMSNIMGNKVAANPAGAKRIADAGMEIGSHTWEHPNMTTIPTADIAAQFSKANDAIASATGHPPVLYRPAGGLSDGAVK